jgi:pimeloyl-ACP methyl ester carboxylesterase
MAFIETKDGTSLFFNDWGTGKPVVLIHGWPLDSDMWEYQWPFLVDNGLRVVAYDRRGFGRSGQPLTGYDYDTMADDLKAVLDGLDLRDVTLVGFSMGGGEVARYMSRHHGGRGTFDAMIDGLRKDRPCFLATFGKQFFGASLLNFTVSTEILQWSLMMAMLGSPKATIECVRAFAATDFRRDMGTFHVPTLIIHGDSDATVPVAKSARLAAAMIPQARLLEYPGAPHGLFFTEKDRLNQDLLDFIR